MLPPVCELCDLDFRYDLEKDETSGGLVRFADFQDLPDGKVGHPKGLGWFCARHLKDAQFLSSLSKSAAIAQLTLNYSKKS